LSEEPTRNASGQRRILEQTDDKERPDDDSEAPLLRKLMEEYAATGLPPAYISKPEKGGKK